MNLFQEAKSILDKDGKVNALGPMGNQKLTGREVSAYFRRNKVKDKNLRKAVEVALDLAGSMTIAYKEITKFYGKKIAKSKEVAAALKWANEEHHKSKDKPHAHDLEEAPFVGSPSTSSIKSQNPKDETSVRIHSKDLGVYKTLKGLASKSKVKLSKDLNGLIATGDILKLIKFLDLMKNDPSFKEMVDTDEKELVSVIKESKMGDLLIDIQMGATAKELSRDHNISLATAKNFLADYYSGKKKPRKAPGLKKEGVEEAFDKKKVSGKIIAKKMEKHKTLKAFAKRVAKMRTVSAWELDQILPDYVSGGDIGALFSEEVCEEANLQEEMIQDFEIRFGKESDWRKAEKIVMAYLKKDVPKHAKSLLTKTSVIGPDPMMVAVGDTQQKLKPPVNLNKLYNSIRKLRSSRDKYWISIPKNQEKDALGEETIQEGTWAVPDSMSKIEELQKWLKKKLTINTDKDTDKAWKQISHIVGDDGVADEWYLMIGKKGDARDPVVAWLKEWGFKVSGYNITHAPATYVSGMDDDDQDTRKVEAKKKRVYDNPLKGFPYNEDLDEGLFQNMWKKVKGKGKIKKPKGSDAKKTKVESVDITEAKETVIDVAARIADKKGAEKYKGVLIDLYTASLITNIYNKVNDSNKAKMEKMPLDKLVHAVYKIAGMKENMQEIMANEWLAQSGTKRRVKEGDKRKETVEGLYRNMVDMWAEEPKVLESSLPLGEAPVLPSTQAGVPTFDYSVEDGVKKYEDAINGQMMRSQFSKMFKERQQKVVARKAQKFYRVEMHEMGKAGSIHAFIDISNGDIFKPAGWKKAAKGARGNVRDQAYINYVSKYPHAYHGSHLYK